MLAQMRGTAPVKNPECGGGGPAVNREFDRPCRLCKAGHPGYRPAHFEDEHA